MIISCDTNDPQVSMNINGKNYDCLIDSGATYSALVEAVEQKDQQAEVTGIEGETEMCSLDKCKINLEGKFGTSHTFLFTPRCPINLLGRDLLCKLRAQVNFDPERIELTIAVMQMFQIGDRIKKVSVKTLPEEVSLNVNPVIWDTDHPKKVIPLIPINIKIKRGVQLPNIKQRPLTEQALRGLEPLMKKYQEHRLIEPCFSPCNTAIMAIPKPKERPEDITKYRFVQNLKAIRDHRTNDGVSCKPVYDLK